MEPLFIYGQLLDTALLEVVIGHGSGDLTFRPAQMPGYRVARVPGTPLPAITAAPGALARGRLIDGLDAADLERLDFFEAAFGWHRHKAEVRDQEGAVVAQVYFPPEPPSDARRDWPEDWNPDLWIAADQGLTVETAREFMGLFGAVGAEPAGQLWQPMRMRAVARLNARAPGVQPPPSLAGYDHRDVEIARSALPYVDYFAVEEFWLRFRRFDGAMSEEVKRAVFATGDAVTVLPYDPWADTVGLIEQLRMGPLARTDPQPWLLEPVAGRVEVPGAIEETARRECREEAGFEPVALEPVAGYYPSPGAFSEYLHSFIGIADLSGRSGGVHGLEEEAEDIRLHVFACDEALAMLADGRARNAPLILSLQWLARNRERLQRAHARD